MSQVNGNGLGGIRFLFRALRHRNYRLFFTGQGVSLIGTWMQGTALGWVIREKTGSDALFWLGFIPAVGQLPTFGLPLLTGVLADRVDRRKIMLITQSLAMIQALVLAVLEFEDMLRLRYIIALSVAIGLINAFDIPARQSFTVDMVEDRADLGNAIALNSSLVNGARIFGPAIGGLILRVVGAAMCFFVNAASYLAVLAALLCMRVKKRPAPAERKRVLHDLREGLAYAIQSPPIRTVLMLIATVSFMGVSYGALMPAVAKDILHGEELMYGTLLSAVGVGALGGAAFLASRKTVRGMKTTIAMSACLFGLGLVAFSFSTVYWVSLLLLLVVGFGFMVTMSASNTFLQAIVDDDKRGRVMSFWTISFMGMVPLGSFYTGFVAHAIGQTAGQDSGAMWTIRIGGCVIILAAMIFATRLPMLRRMTHPIYIRKGLIPQSALAGANMPPENAGETLNPTMVVNNGPVTTGPGKTTT